MKNTLMIDMDTERKDVIRLSKPESLANEVDDSETARLMVLNDLTTVCNALGTLIHLADTNGYLDNKKACNMCIEFLNDNFLNVKLNKESSDSNDLELKTDDENTTTEGT